jgi:hypothetical protein
MRTVVGRASARRALHRRRGALYHGGQAPPTVAPTEQSVIRRRLGRSKTDSCPAMPPWSDSMAMKEGLQP